MSAICCQACCFIFVAKHSSLCLSELAYNNHNNQQTSAAGPFQTLVQHFGKTQSDKHILSVYRYNNIWFALSDTVL